MAQVSAEELPHDLPTARTEPLDVECPTECRDEERQGRRGQASEAYQCVEEVEDQLVRGTKGRSHEVEGVVSSQDYHTLHMLSHINHLDITLKLLCNSSSGPLPLPFSPPLSHDHYLNNLRVLVCCEVCDTTPTDVSSKGEAMRTKVRRGGGGAHRTSSRIHWSSRKTALKWTRFTKMVMNSLEDSGLQ